MELSPEEMKFIRLGGQIKVSRLDDKIITTCSISKHETSIRSSIPDESDLAAILRLSAAIKSVFDKRMVAVKESLRPKPKSPADNLIDNILGGGINLGDIFGGKKGDGQ